MQQPFITREILSHKLVLLALGALVLIAVGSGIYYVVATRTPSAHWATPSQGSIAEVVTGTGTVTPAQNPDLAFASGGRVAYVSAQVGQSVAEGQTLASLDTAALAAQRSQAAANLAAAQAKLDEMQAGPRQTDVSIKQTAVASAQQSLANLYAAIPASIMSASDKTAYGVSGDTDSLFSAPESLNPQLLVQTSESQAAINAANDRVSLNTALAKWQSLADSLSGASSPGDLDAALRSSLTTLALARTYSADLLSVLSAAVPSASFTATQLSTAQTNVVSLNDTINSLVTALQGQQQQIASGALAVQSAQDALNQVLAGSTPQDIEAQQATVDAARASVQAIDAQLANAVVVAPFAGTVASVNIKAGQIVPQNTIAVSLTPHSALEVELYLTEVDVAKLAVGNDASVTLDAYGAGRPFPARVVSIDRSPTQQGAVPAYKVTLQFVQDDPAIASGMTANASVTAAQKDNALIIPRSAVIENNGQAFVLVPSAHGPLEQPVVLGLVSTSSVEVLSGLGPNDQFLTSTY